MKILSLIILTIFSINSFAKCLDYDKSQTSIMWEAFKTPAKAGVKGEFKGFDIKPSKTKAQLKDILLGSTFSIDSSSVFTKNPARDKKIVSNFFSKVEIKGKVTQVKQKVLTLELTMNNKKVKVPMNYILQGHTLSANGTIDVFDFMMQDNLSAINKACYALHEGKTWNDVNIYLKSTFKPCK